MTKETLPAIALRVAEEMNKVKREGKSFTARDAVIDNYAIAFAERLMDEVTKQAEPVAYRAKVYAGPNFMPDGYVWRYACHPSTYHDLPQQPLFLHPSPDVGELKAEIERLRAALSQVKEQCLFVDDDGQIGVSSEAQIDSQLFDEIVEALAAPKGD